MSGFKVGDRVRAKGTSGWAVTVSEVAAVFAKPYPFQIFRTEPFGPWNLSGDFEPAPPEKPKYRFIDGGEGAMWTEDTVTGEPLLYAYTENRLPIDSRKSALRTGMAAIGYEEQQ